MNVREYARVCIYLWVYLQVYERLLEHQDQVKKKKASGKTQNLATVVYQVSKIVHIEFCWSSRGTILRPIVTYTTHVTFIMLIIFVPLFAMLMDGIPHWPHAKMYILMNMYVCMYVHGF